MIISGYFIREQQQNNANKSKVKLDKKFREGWSHDYNNDGIF